MLQRFRILPGQLTETTPKNKAPHKARSGLFLMARWTIRGFQVARRLVAGFAMLTLVCVVVTPVLASMQRMNCDRCCCHGRVHHCHQNDRSPVFKSSGQDCPGRCCTFRTGPNITGVVTVLPNSTRGLPVLRIDVAHTRDPFIAPFIAAFSNRGPPAGLLN